MGTGNTHWRYGARGNTWSTRCAAVSAIRRAVHDGHRAVGSAREITGAGETDSRTAGSSRSCCAMLDLHPRRTRIFDKAPLREPSLVLNHKRAFEIDALASA